MLYGIVQHPGLNYKIAYFRTAARFVSDLFIAWPTNYPLKSFLLKLRLKINIQFIVFSLADK